ncbi:MAG: hypothetical protein ACRD1E_02155, partial [Terriglobales bacterium]
LEICSRYYGAGAAPARLELGALAAGAGLRPEQAAVEAWTPYARRQWGRLSASAATQPEVLQQLRALPARAWERLRLALEASDWMAEVLIRRPALASALALDDAAAPPQPASGGDFAAGMADLRLWRLRETLRLLCMEWEQRTPIEASLRAHSLVAEQTLRAAWAMLAPPSPSLAVLALGRLGLRELDLQSDLDLVFVAASSEREAASRAAASFIQILTAYTQAGSLYAVDTRLRPGGREGELVQTRESLSQYFRQRAGAWEAVSYLKARLVAGNSEVGGAALQAVAAATAPRLAGQDLRQEFARLRQRMEREGRPGRWGLKTGPGGYYDVDFLLSRRLLQAGLPGRPGQGLADWARGLPAALLPAEVSSELADLTSLLRAADHALRVATGKAGSSLPATGAAVERAWAWLARVQELEAQARTGAPPAPGAAAVDGARARIREIYLGWSDEKQ